MKNKSKHKSLVNIIDNRLHSNIFNGKRFYTTIDKELEYGYSNGCLTGEIDNIAIRHGKKHTYILLFEDKSCNKHEDKAEDQLNREKRYLQMKKYNKNFRIWTFYVHGFSKDKTWSKYEIKKI